jgi:hypothetical protein
MDPATLEAPVETPVDSMPDEGGSSFLDSLNAAFAGLDENKPLSEPVQPKVGDVPVSKDPLEGDVDPAAPVEEPKAAEDDFLSSDTELPDDWTPKAAHRFQQLKAELKQSRTELETLRQERVAFESQLQELKGAAESKNYETLEQKVKEYEQQRMLVDLESTQVFQESVSAPIEKLVGQAREIADRYDIDHDALLDAFALDDEAAQEEQLSEILVDASDRDKARIYRIIEELNPVFERRAELYKNVEEALSEAKFVEEERANAQAAERARERAQVTKVVADRLAEKVPFLSSFEGLDLQKVAAAAAEVDPSAVSTVDNSYNAIVGKLFPTIVKEYATLQKELDVLTERLATYQKAEPGFDASGGDGKRTPVADEEMGLNEALRRALGQ